MNPHKNHLKELAAIVRAEEIYRNLNAETQRTNLRNLIILLETNPPKGFDNGTNGVTNTWWHYAHSVEGFEFLNNNVRFGVSVTKLRGAFFGLVESDEKTLMTLNKKNNGWDEIIQFLKTKNETISN